MKSKREELKSWCRFGAVSPRNKSLLSMDSDNYSKSEDVMVCRNSFLSMLNVGRKMLRAVRTNPSKVHGLMGRSGGLNNHERKYLEIHESLQLFFV